MRNVKIDGVSRWMRIAVLAAAAGVASLPAAAVDRDAAWRQDLQVMATQLPARHLDFFAHLSRTDFEAAVARLDAAIPGLKDPEIVVELMRLSAMAGDAHTWASPMVAPFYAGWRFFPLRLYWYPDGLRVVQADSANTRLTGLRVVQVGGVPIEEVERLVAPLISHENDYWVRARSPLMLVSLEILQSLGVLPAGTEATFLLEAPDGSRVRADLEARSLAETAWLSVKAPAAAPLSAQHPELFYWYQYLPNEKVLYFQYNVCMEQPGRPLAAFTSELLSWVDTHPVDAFVVDLRYNNGGNSALIQPLFTGMRARLGPARVYGLIGRETMSSGLNNSIDLATWFGTAVTFVGEPTGGKPNSFGDILRFSLPSSGISVSYSTKLFHPLSTDPPALFPDVALPPLYDDVSSGRDRVLDAVTSRAIPAIARPAWSAAILAPAAGQRLDAGRLVRFAASGTGPGEAPTYTWDFGDGTKGQGELAEHAFGAPGTYGVTLTVSSSTGRAEAHVDVEVVDPTGGEAEVLLPVVLENGSSETSGYTTELTLESRSATRTTVELGYTASVGEGSGWVSLQLAPGEMRVLPDAIEFLRQSLPIPPRGSGPVGTLRARFLGAAAGEVFVGGRTSTPGLGGTFGLFYAAAGTTQDPLTLFGLQQNEAQRSNIALVNGGGEAVTLRVQLTGPAGEDLGVVDRAVPGWGWVQLNRPLEGKATSGRAVVTRLSGSSPFTAYGVLNDAITSDGSYIPPRASSLGGAGDQLVPVVLDVRGIGGSHYTTELTLANLTKGPLSATLVYSASLGTGAGEVAVSLAPGEQRIIPDAVAFLRDGGIPIPADGSPVGGALVVRPPSGVGAQDLAVGARTFTTAPGGGTFGVFYPGLTLGEAADSTAWVNGLQQNGRQRSNLALVNWGDQGDSIDLEISTFGASDGRPAGEPVRVTLKPLEWLQLGQPLEALGLEAGYARITRTSGSSRFVAYGVLNDASTSDGSYVPMTR